MREATYDIAHRLISDNKLWCQLASASLQSCINTADNADPRCVGNWMGSETTLTEDWGIDWIINMGIEIFVRWLFRLTTSLGKLIIRVIDTNNKERYILSVKSAKCTQRKININLKFHRSTLVAYVQRKHSERRVLSITKV